MGLKGVHTFSNGISSKENIVAELKFEPVAVQHVNHNTIRNADLVCKKKITWDLMNFVVQQISEWKYNLVKLATLVEGNPKALFSIATTPKCRGGRYSISWINPLYPKNLPYNT